VQAFLLARLCFPTRKVQSIGLRCYEKYMLLLLFRRISVVEGEKRYETNCVTLYTEKLLCEVIRNACVSVV
jgi:hypothetical protein